MVRGLICCLLLLLAVPPLAPAEILLSEGFDDITTLPAAGWAMINNSNPVGTTSWFQGVPGLVPPPPSGADDSYIAANFLNTDPLGGNINNWLLTPMLSLFNGLQFSFYTVSAGTFPDRLELRLSTNGASTDVGATDMSTGDFGTLLLSINPDLGLGEYPPEWTRYYTELGGLPGPTTGRLGFRYYIVDTTVNGDYIGIDSVTVATPEPGTIACLGIGLAGLALWRRLGRRAAAVLLVLSVSALVPVLSAKDGKKPPSKKAAAVQAHRADAGIRVFKDPATGKLREPEPGEIQELQPAAAHPKAGPARRAGAGVLTGPQGAIGMMLGDEQMVYSVATRNPDGTIAMECQKGPEKARQALERTRGERSHADVQ